MKSRGPPYLIDYFRADPLTFAQKALCHDRNYLKIL